LDWQLSLRRCFVIALFLMESGTLSFTLFLGISMSITAFPVLVRILEEREMQSTPLGATAILCTAVDDVSAWLLLAVTMTLISSGHSSMSLSHRFLWLGVYLLVMFFVIRRLGMWLSKRHESGALSYELLGVVIVVGFVSAAVTDAIGAHPLFGAFLAGLCFPRVKYWQEALRTRLDVVVSLVLLPLFSALTGLRTRLDLLSGTKI
jgi:Kef-type K+ transport system membrane component KefB